MQYTLKGVKLVSAKGNEGVKVQVNVEKTYEDGAIREGIVTYKKRVPHPDFFNALKNLAVHYAIIVSRMKEKNIADQNELEKYHVSGYSIGGKDESVGVTITGHFKGTYGAVIENSPFLRFNNENYVMMPKLEEDITLLEFEAEQFMKGIKVGNPELFEEAEPVTHAQIAEPEMFVDDKGIKEKPKKRVKQSPENPSGTIEE